MEMSVMFANLEQATADYRAAVTNLTTENITLIKQVELYANLLYTKEANSMALQTDIKNLQV